MAERELLYAIICYPLFLKHYEKREQTGISSKVGKIEA